ncbi:helix-turn-helix domain-containing protein [Microscilla marina]|uniref:Transcriptional regulator, putative n=1 Tax=Microscilla marina ATCC 23134 TaxID=313606 RepID=A1ZK87_MICM2|nr:helix-turn-helix domain-containing protein [Microscilla marina]EAY29113.1 transcriptional regulator, putative [Microscilla marina ATCC 23134]
MQNFLNQLVYFGYLQSLFLIFIYLFSPTRRKTLNQYLIVFVLVLTVGLTGRVLYMSEVFGKNFKLITISEFAILLFGATIYLFTRSSLFDKRFSYRDLVHYIPGVVYIILITVFFIIPTKEAYIAKYKSGQLLQMSIWFAGVGLLFNITYWVLSCRLFFAFKKKLQNELSYVVKTRFFLTFLIAIGACLLCWVVVYLMSIYGNKFIAQTTRQALWLSIALIILLIAYYGMTAPDLFRLASVVKTKKYAHSRLSQKDLDQLKYKLEQLMENKKPYLNRKLLKSELAGLLGVSNPEVARLLNERIGMTFFEYVNYYRIKEFIALAQTEEAQKFTIFGIAQEAGFNSKTTFNKSFKKLMGASPSEYFAKK